MGHVKQARGADGKVDWTGLGGDVVDSTCGDEVVSRRIYWLSA
jgi:hypothetical protein